MHLDALSFSTLCILSVANSRSMRIRRMQWFSTRVPPVAMSSDQTSSQSSVILVRIVFYISLYSKPVAPKYFETGYAATPSWKITCELEINENFFPVIGSGHLEILKTFP